MREVSISRETAETKVEVVLNIDGVGESEISEVRACYCADGRCYCDVCY